MVPQQGRNAVLDELHETHPGASKMKSLARSYLWWPGVDADIVDMVKKCKNCQESRPSPPVAPLHPWEWPSQPWSRIHVDFAGPFLGEMYVSRSCGFLFKMDGCSNYVIYNNFKNN